MAYNIRKWHPTKRTAAVELSADCLIGGLARFWLEVQAVTILVFLLPCPPTAAWGSFLQRP